MLMQLWSRNDREHRILKYPATNTCLLEGTLTTVADTLIRVGATTTISHLPVIWRRKARLLKRLPTGADVAHFVSGP